MDIMKGTIMKTLPITASNEEIKELVIEMILR